MKHDHNCCCSLCEAERRYRARLPKDTEARCEDQPTLLGFPIVASSDFPAFPAGSIVLGPLTQTDCERLWRRWNEQYRGPGNGEPIVILPAHVIDRMEDAGLPIERAT